MSLLPLNTIAAEAPITAKKGEYSGLSEDILQDTNKLASEKRKRAETSSVKAFKLSGVTLYECQRLERRGECKSEVTNPKEEQLTGREEENGDPEAVT